VDQRLGTKGAHEIKVSISQMISGATYFWFLNIL
jgi:hypothetical protein